MKNTWKYFEHVDGCLDAPAVAIRASLLSYQEQHGLEGNLLIGMWTGKSAGLQPRFST